MAAATELGLSPLTPRVSISSALSKDGHVDCDAN